ncbi:ABC transporter ATP-binding protein [Cryobacterium tepidiphilum]|uniref:ABC transporter ATP-binding protein n=1 Tax=Cryobacterium tepidiphilum TaxID=2486026 RepID=A0A3M8LMN4_9MICO|nr:ABC transporter ATP-binding protein [Cryobacterium tepidiphilum]RNE66786.1 ABC transporter ATP-binding protein [Cryobacterium tepidiphilum]
MLATLESRTSTALAVQARDVVKIYGRDETTVRALDGATLQIEAGRFTAIMGPSGSGKSTMMHAMAGLDTIDSGQVLIGSTDITALGEKQRTLLRRERIGFVFQSFNLVPALTASENIALPLTLAGKRPDPAWMAELASVLGIEQRLTHRPHELSGGQQQRVAVARALIARPEVVFADEPTGNLDSRHGEALLGILRKAAHEMGQTIVMVTHDPSAASHVDRIVFLADGRVIDELEDPTVPAILSKMAHLEAPSTRIGE